MGEHDARRPGWYRKDRDRASRGYERGRGARIVGLKRLTHRGVPTDVEAHQVPNTRYFPCLNRVSAPVVTETRCSFKSGAFSREALCVSRACHVFLAAMR